MAYGSKMPKQQDLPSKYYPRPESFVSTFNGGNYIDTGLNTYMQKSKFHASLDQ